jgi:hypothetical protein
VLKRQRIRWHRGLMQAVGDFMPMTFNPRYRNVGMISWAGYFLFEYLAPMIEVAGWIAVGLGLWLGAFRTEALVLMVLLAFGAGLLSSMAALLLDEPYGYFNSPRDTARLIVMALIENVGFRQMTVLWRIRAQIGGSGVKTWGNMERRGVASLSEN